MADDRPSCYVEDGVAIYRGSAVGHACVTQLVAARLGYQASPPPPWLQDRYDEGTAAEPVIIERLRREHGWTITGDGDENQLELEIPVGNMAKIRLHPDGLATIPDQKVNEFVLEVKFFGEDYFKKFTKEGVAGFEGYAWQTALEMAATGLPCAFVVARKPERLEDKTLDPAEFWDTELSFQFLEKPLVSLAEIKKKVVAVEMAAGRGEIPECGAKVFPCGYPQLCGGDKEKDEDAEADPVLDAAAVFYDDCRAKEAHWKAQKEKVAKARLLEVLGDRESITTGQWAVGWEGGGPGKPVLNESALIADHPEIDLEKYREPGKPGSKRIYVRKAK